MDVKDKKIVVIGIARSGVGAANLLCKLGATVTVTDKKGPDEVKDYLKKLDINIKLKLGNHPPELFENADLIVVSPGVPLNIPPLKAASEKGIKVISELELAYEIILSQQSKAGSKKAEFLAITGTNGKSTTTMLLHEMIKNGGFNAIVGGNIGNALTEEISNLQFQISKFDYIVAEVSSFQLDAIDKFRPKVSTILNITPDHLDRYHCMSEYIDSKCRIFLNQCKGDFIVLNADDPATDDILIRMRNQESLGMGIPEIFYFSMRQRVEGAYYDYNDKVISFNLPEYKIRDLRCRIDHIPPDFHLVPSDFKIKGVHNIENSMAASLIALLSGCKTEIIYEVLSSYPGLEHRLEFVRDINGVRFINDSKGTNVGAVMKSLEGFYEPVILIAGGRDKHGDFTLLRTLVKEKVKALILIGEAREKIKNALGDLTRVFFEESLKDSVFRAKSISVNGDIVLLSPACASFDMFNDFEDRGRQFKKLVMEL